MQDEPGQDFAAVRIALREEWLGLRREAFRMKRVALALLVLDLLGLVWLLLQPTLTRLGY